MPKSVMSKENINPRTIAQAAKIAGFHCKEVEEMAKDLGKRMVTDQAEWLDNVMKDLLPPRLYAAGHAGELEEEIAEYIKRHGIVIIWIPDRLGIRIMLHGKVHAEFKTQLTVDGEPVCMKPEMPLDGNRN